jgi:hypothetical protein
LLSCLVRIFDKRRPSKNENGRLFIDSFIVENSWLWFKSESKEEGRFVAPSVVTINRSRWPVYAISIIKEKEDRPTPGVRFTQFRINALNRKKTCRLRLKNFAWCKNNRLLYRKRPTRNAELTGVAIFHGYHI